MTGAMAVQHYVELGRFPSTFYQTRKALAITILCLVCKSALLISRFLPAFRTLNLTAAGWEFGFEGHEVVRKASSIYLRMFKD